MIPISNPSKKLNREENSMKTASTKAPIQASTPLKFKEKLQVRIDSSSSSNKIKNTKSSQNSIISLRPASPNPAAKDLEKSLNLKPLRSPMKKNSGAGAGLHHTVNLSRATCSTAIKVARNPDSLELNEPKVKLCTYSYCSLHNQRQEAPFPVVKCFLRTKRQSFEPQNRMNLRKKASRIKNDQNKVEKIDDNTKGAERSPGEVDIVNIACRINGMMLEDCDESNQQQDSYSVTSFDDFDDEDKNSEISTDEIEVFDDDRVQCTDDAKQQGEHSEIEKHESYIVDRNEAASWPYPQNSPKKFEDFFCETIVIPENECQVFTNESLQSRIGIPKSPKLDVHCEEEHDMKAKMANSPQKFDDFFCQTIVIPENECQVFTNESLQSRIGIPKSPKLDVHCEEEHETKAKMANSPQKFDDFFCDTKVIPLSTSNIFPENEDEECKYFTNGSLQSRVDIPNSPKLEAQCDEELDTKAKMTNSGLHELFKHESQLKVTTKSNIDGENSDELACKKEKVTNSTSLISKNPLTELTNSPKAKFNSTMRRTRADNHENNAREFNPRTPRFLPPKTEAAAEKVSLKHQPMEERKMAEEWMIDYALRQTLRRMAPARKKKVSLLVAAFESVIQQELKMS